MMAKIILSITFVITFDYVLTMIKLHDIASKIDKLEKKINTLEEQQGENE